MDPQQEANPYATEYQSELKKMPSQQQAPAVPTKSPSALQTIGTGALNLGKGVVKGALGTVANIDQASRKYLPSFMTNQYFGMGKPTDVEGEEQKAQTHGTMQAIGKGVEQAGEFMLPGGAEEKAVSMLPKGLQMAGKIGAAAIGSGAVNKAQGGDFGTGAAAGAGGSMIGAGLKTVAPKLAESALGITKADRAFGKTPGEAIINETKGIRPGTIADSANSKLGSLTPELESAAANASGPAHLTPARDVVSNAQKTATKQNAASLHGQLQPMSDFLSKRFDTGKQIPSDVAPSELLDLKRGMSKEFLGHWNPETHADTLATGRKAYGALDSELDRTVPAAAGINQRISSLIPVAHRAESTARNAPVAQKMIGRFAAPTGALAGGLFGGEEGYRHGGLPGAVAGAAGGLAAPLLIATPEGQMVMARTLNHAPAMTPALTGAALQLNRKKENQ